MKKIITYINSFGVAMGILLIVFIAYYGSRGPKMVMAASIAPNSTSTSPLEALIEQETLAQLHNPNFVSEWNALEYKAAHQQVMSAIINKIQLDEEADLK